jgi:hypothetical protein
MLFSFVFPDAEAVGSPGTRHKLNLDDAPLAADRKCLAWVLAGTCRD